MKQAFRRYVPRTDETRLMIERADAICTQYMEQGYTLTLRQLFYRFVGKKWIENTERSYKRMGAVIADAREGGLIDWDAIEDRGRWCSSPSIEEQAAEVLRGVEHGLMLDLWARQPKYLEVWVEKDALAAVVGRACSPLRVPYMACKGYLSVSERYLAGGRFLHAQARGQECVLIHLGDHDPSGIDMTRDNGEALRMFTNPLAQDNLEDVIRAGVKVERVALNKDQVKRYRLPPNPAKHTDARFGAYRKKHGSSSWELDAMEPAVLDALIQKAIRKHWDEDLWEFGLADEEHQRRHLRQMQAKYPRIVDMLEGRTTYKRKFKKLERQRAKEEREAA